MSAKDVLIVLTLAAAVSACSPSEETGSDEDPGASATEPSVLGSVDTQDPYTRALEADRLERDLQRDDDRRPDEVIRFFGIEPGMKVLDLFAGGGYYTEYVRRVVGPEGEVHSHNNQAYLGFAAEELELRFAEGRLADVERIVQEAQDADFRDGYYDAALLILAYHDLHYVNEAGGWPPIDADAFLSEVYAALEPGGVLGVVDHSAPAGSGSDAAQHLHRIEQAFLIEDMEEAGFVLEAEADILRNPEDDLDLPIFNQEIRGRTDRFVLRFRKPEPQPEPEQGSTAEAGPGEEG